MATRAAGAVRVFRRALLKLSMARQHASQSIVPQRSYDFRGGNVHVVEQKSAGRAGCGAPLRPALPGGRPEVELAGCVTVEDRVAICRRSTLCTRNTGKSGPGGDQHLPVGRHHRRAPRLGRLKRCEKPDDRRPPGIGSLTCSSASSYAAAQRRQGRGPWSQSAEPPDWTRCGRAP